MNLLKIRLIVLLERFKKVTAVAEELGVKQPTISFHMRKMEEEWGTPLFEMKTGKVMLTEAGRLLHHYAEQIDRLYAEAEARMKELQRNGLHKYVIGCNETANAAFLRGSWLTAASELADIQLSLLTGDNDRLHQLLLEGGADLILTSRSSGLSAGNNVLLVEDPLMLLLPAVHPLAGTANLSSLSTYRLAQLPFVLLEDSSLKEAVTAWEAAERMTLSVRWTTDRIEHVISAVRTGSCLTVIPSRCVSETAAGIVSIPLPGSPVYYRMYASWLSSGWSPQLAGRMVGMLQQQAGNAYK
ncbi:LysR family transcriptional regulator [Paenibacillus spongiae]|uniref:LysR family transcriptional regulator n=1 Tax=Paenibacillus spongiae TaxID=2909671 RepID=A0ABY5S3L6_9BACL|nr:LysR family transcriptional regulator [Paenibacillus spongiae]UVI28491.1 LysR family transcriptional regulator [Paenibacillus spongiae]